MVANMSDDDIWRLNRGGHDARKVYARLRGGDAAQGPADRDPRQDRQGFRHGQGRRRPEHHAPAEEARRRGAARVPRPLQYPGAATRTSPSCRSASRPHGQRGDALPARAAQGARRLPAAARTRRNASSRCRRSTASSRARGHRRARDLHHHGASCASSASCSRTRTSASTSCRSCPTRRAPSAWKACSARSASTRRWDSSTRRRTPTS